MRFRIGAVSKCPYVNNTLAWMGVVAMAVAICWVVLVHGAMRLLTINAPMATADWIVVLGGESGERVIRAAELYHNGIAPNVFVSGAGDCLTNVRRLEMAGVPAAKIAYECSSQTTYENAIYTRQALAPFNPTKIVLVTSWFQTKRSLRVFKQIWSSAQFGAVGVVPGGISYYWLPIHESGAVTVEYVKTLWYWVRYSSLVKSLSGD